VIDAKPNYGYHLRSVDGKGHNEGGGAYATKHEATKAAFARIETLTFDRKEIDEIRHVRNRDQ
jgi:hypothetical protein